MERTVLYSVKRPWQPLSSDKTVMWLASTYAAAGYRVRPLTDKGVSTAGCDLLLTNRDSAHWDFACPVINIGSDGDSRDRIRLALGRLYGRSRYYQKQGGVGGFYSSLLRPLKKILSGRRALPIEEIAPEGVPGEINGRRVVFRVNVDWDARGLDILERWCETYGFRPTLVIAGTEIKGSEQRLKSFAANTGCDIASHSWSHYLVMSSHGRARQRREITDNHEYLGQLLGCNVKGFVAPYIKYDRRTFEILAESGYKWFIRSWLLHPLPLGNSGLIDLGVSFGFGRLWQNRILSRLAHSDIVLQLHLPDLVRHEHLLEHNIRLLLQHGVRIIDCETFYRETATKE